MPVAPTTILLVEDNPDDAELVRIAMADAGIGAQLEVVQDGATALQYVRSEGPYVGVRHPHLVLLDLNLPGVDGREVLRVMKSDPRLCTIPIIVMARCMQNAIADHGA